MAPWLLRFKNPFKGFSGGSVLSGSDNASPTLSADTSVKRTTSKKKQVALPPTEPLRIKTYSFPTDGQGLFSRREVGGAGLGGEEGGGGGGGGGERRIDPAHANVPSPVWELAPTLHHKRSNTLILRRKSSDRKKGDYGREAEIKAMSKPVPGEAATYAWAPGAPPKQVHRRARTMSADPGWKHHLSEVSLPLHSSIHSSRSSESELFSYRVSALDALAPRPTLRCVGTRIISSRGSIPTRTISQKRTLADREPIPEETLKAHKRVDDLADNFDASELRELMERDARRRERHQQREREKLERKLSLKAERHKLEKAEARKSGTRPPENLERGVVGRELAGLGMDPPSTVLTSSKQRTSLDPMYDADEELPEDSIGAPKSPLDSFHPADETLVEQTLPPSAEDPSQTVIGHEGEPMAEMSSSLRLDGGPRSNKSMSKSTLGFDQEKTGSIFGDEAMTRKDSVGSSRTNHLSIISLLKWGLRGRRGSNSPSSFSNLSREEMQAAAAAHTRILGDGDSALSAPVGNYLSKAGLGTPKRTRSRFREDLPELPLRVETESAEVQLPKLSEDKVSRMESSGPDGIQDEPPSPAHRSAKSSIEVPPAIVISPGKMSRSQTFEPPMSVSLASVDSEGSWLSGRIGSQRSTTREAAGIKRRNQEQQFSESLGNRNLGDDAGPEDETMREGHARWAAVDAQPQTIHIHRPDRDTVNSREVLLDIDSGDEEELESPVSRVSEDKVDLQHARSVSVNHIRNYSAGSAKLLEITFLRASVDGGNS